MRLWICFVLVFSGVARGERDAELDALLGEAEATTQDEKTVKKSLEPLFVIPFQPIWNSVEPDVVEEAFKHIADVLREDAGYEVRLFRQRGRLERGADPSARVAKKYYKEMAYAETLLKLRKPGQALRAVKPVLRKMWQNARHLRGADTYCRCLAILVESNLKMGKKKAAQNRANELVTRCDGAFLNTTSLKYGQSFADLLAARSKASVDDRSASLTIHADLPKAKILLNGRTLGEAPLTITDLPKGRHLIGVVKRDHRAWGATPVLKAGQSLELRATVTRGIEDKGLRKMFGTLRDNRIDRAVMREATQMLRRRGRGASLGILGVLGRDGGKIRMTLFGFNKEGRALRLKQADFGQDFLTVNLAMSGVSEKLAELKSSGGRSLVAGEPLISGLRQGSWAPKGRQWVSMRDDQRAMARSQAAAAARAKGPRGPLARRKKGAGSSVAPTEIADRIEREASRSTGEATGRSKAVKTPPQVDPKVVAAEEKAATLRRAAKAAATRQAAAEKAERDKQLAAKRSLEEREAAAARKAEAEKRRTARAERWAAWRARFGTFLSTDAWRAKASRQWLSGIRFAQQVDGVGGDLDLSLARRLPSVFSGSHWRWGASVGISTRPADFTNPKTRMDGGFYAETRASDDLAEGFRHEGGVAGRMGVSLGLDRSFGNGPLSIRFDAGSGLVARESTLIHEQFVLENDERVLNTGIDLRSSDPFVWAGFYWSLGLGLEYVWGRHHLSLDGQVVDTTLRTVESFGTIEFPGELNESLLVGLGYASAF